MWDEAVEELERRRKKQLEGGGQKRKDKQHAQGKLLARERLEILFDEGTFVEVNDFVESRIDDFDLAKKRVAGDGVITGYGKINGRLTFASSEDFTVMGGTLGEYHSLKICKIQEMALHMRAPFISINDSGGARIEEGICSLSGYSGIFLRNTMASGVIPQISVIMGPCSGGACYSPAISDFVFMVQDTSTMFITGPRVVKTVINEDSTIEELGGAKIHATVSGSTHFVYEDEKSCLEGVKKLLSYLPQNCTKRSDIGEKLSQKAIEKKQKEARQLYDLVPSNSRKPYDVKKVIEVLVDEGSFFEVQSEFAKNAVIGFARMNGEVVGMIANQPKVLSGSLDCDSSDKIARWIRFCDCFSIPLITLVDVPAFYPGKDQEHKGIIRHGAKILYAYSEATVPKITLIMRKAYGGAYIAMNSKNMGADIVYAWPIAELAVMGTDGAVSIAFKKKIKESENPEKTRQELIEDYEKQFMNPYIAAARGYVDQVIKPEETRESLLKALAMLKDKQVVRIEKKHGNIPL